MAAGTAYSQFAIVAVLLHDDLRAANPITVLRALMRCGRDSPKAGALTFLSSALICVTIPLLFRLSMLAAAAAVWFYWVAVLYVAMVVGRVLGLVYRRNATALEWFPDRPRWGVRGA
jgi:hypothetical protein